MIRINLLPHREQARKDRRQQFYSWAVLMLLVGGLVWFVGSTAIGMKIDRQNGTNDFLKREIAVLDEQISEIARLKEQTDALLARKKVIESLQGSRTETVAMFNELTKQMPEGVYLSGLKQSGRTVTLTGYAQSNARVSQLMSNLDASPVFENPVLLEIKTVTVNRRVVGNFSLNVGIEQAAEAKDAQGKDSKAGDAKPAASGGKS